jgi:methionyl-tRNA synthetase
MKVWYFYRLIEYDICSLYHYLYVQMSKSRGNVVNPFTELNRLGNDAIRYYLLKEGSLQHDGGELSPIILPVSD